MWSNSTAVSLFQNLYSITWLGYCHCCMAWLRLISSITYEQIHKWQNLPWLQWPLTWVVMISWWFSITYSSEVGVPGSPDIIWVWGRTSLPISDLVSQQVTLCFLTYLTKTLKIYYVVLTQTLTDSQSSIWIITAPTDSRFIFSKGLHQPSCLSLCMKADKHISQNA